MRSENYQKLSPEIRAAIAFEAHTLDDSETVQRIEASFAARDAAWLAYVDRLTNLNLLILSLTGVYWKLAATHDFRGAWTTQEIIETVCERAGVNSELIFECNDIELLPEPVQFDVDWLNELKQTFIARL